MRRLAVIALLGGLTGLAGCGGEDRRVLFRATFDEPEEGRVITSELPDCEGHSPHWRTDSGTWLHDPRDGSGWTGVPDDGAPDSCTAPRETGSAVFRMWTVRDDFTSVRVDVRLRVNAIDAVTTYDGVKIYLRRQGQGTESSEDDAFYTVEPVRRDGDVQIQKKSGGLTCRLADTENGSAPVELGRYREFAATVENLPRRRVRLRLWEEGRLLAEAVDDGSVNGPALQQPGNVGLRGDNTDFNADDLVVSELSDADRRRVRPALPSPAPDDCG